jgi:hypothetical protein
MEDPTILKMNLDHFRRLLELEADPVKRQTILKLIRETEAKLQQHPVQGNVAERFS